MVRNGWRKEYVSSAGNVLILDFGSEYRVFTVYIHYIAYLLFVRFFAYLVFYHGKRFLNCYLRHFNCFAIIIFCYKVVNTWFQYNQNFKVQESSFYFI